MNRESFYPTTLTYNCTTNIVECTDDVNITHNGNIDNYYIGYMNPDDVPSFNKPVRVQWGSQSSKISLSRIDNIDYASFAYIQKTANPTNKNLLYNYANNTYNITTHYRGVNSMSPLNAPIFNLSAGHIWRIDMRVYYLFSDETEHIRVTNAYFTFATATDLIDFLKNGTTKTTDFTITHFASPSVVVNISLSLTAGQFSDGHYMHTDIYDNTSCTLHFVVTGLTCNYTNNWYRNNGITSAVSGCYVSPIVNVKTSETNALCYYANAHYVRIPYNSQNHAILNFSPQLQGGDDYIKIGDLYYGIGIYSNGDIDLRDYENPLEFYALNGCYLAWETPTINGAFELTAIVTWNDIIFTLAQFPCLSSRTAGDIYLPEFDGNRLTGNWFPVEDLDEKGTDWQKSDDIADDEYTDGDKPSGDPDRDNIKPPNREGDSVDLHLNNRFGLFSGFISMYNLTESELSNFGSALLGNPLNYRGNFQKDLSTELSGTYDVSSILNYIVSVKMYPFSIATLPNTTVQATSDVFMGTGQFGVPIGTVCRKLTTSISVLDAGSLYVKPLTPYNDFRDYYNTSIVCYLPYCGTVELNPMDVMNTTLHCYYLIDFLTGDCSAILYSIGENNLNYVVAVANGNIGIDIPLSATNTGQLEAVKRMQNAQTAHTVISFVNSGIDVVQNGLDVAEKVANKEGKRAVFDSVADILNNAGSILDIAFQNEANPYGGNRTARSAVATPLMPTGSGATNFMLNTSVYLQIRRGTYSRPNNYGSTVGYPNSFSARLSSVRGLTYCNNVNVSGINCTLEEKRMIREALESGTIL